MVNHLSIERMQELLGIHGEYERLNDIEGLMTTISANPLFEFHPQGWKVEGREAVREMYTRLCNTILPQFATDNERRKATSADRFGGKDATMLLLSADAGSQFIPEGRSRMVFELESDFVHHDGRIQRFRIFQIVTFEGELLVGERSYTDADLALLFDEALGPDFTSLPGVSRSTI